MEASELKKWIAENLYAEEMLVRYSTYDDLDWPKLKAFCEKKYKATVEDEERDRYIHNFRLGKDGKLNNRGGDEARAPQIAQLHPLYHSARAAALPRGRQRHPPRPGSLPGYYFHQ